MLGEEISAGNLVKIMLDSEEQWNTVNRHVNEVLKSKKEEERRREIQHINIHF